MDRFKFYWEKGDKNELRIEVPGFRRDEIKVSLSGGSLNISASKKQHDVKKGKDFYREESYSTSVSRSFLIPHINPSKFDIAINDEVVILRHKPVKNIRKKPDEFSLS